MTRSNRLVALGAALACVAAGVAVMVSTAQQPRPEQWKKVNDAVNKGLPKTAIKELEPIIESALKDKAYPEAIKAICKKIVLEGNIEGNKPEEKITRMVAAINTAPPEMHPAMNAVLAHWYWHYYNQNRWRIQQRSNAGDTTGSDVTTWDHQRIITEIDRVFDKALAAEKELKATPIATYDALLDKGTIPDKFRPTLYDFLAFDALSFYAVGDQANGPKTEDAFEMTAESPVFASTDAFLKWEPKTTDGGSRTLKAVKLYQKLLAFHATDNDKSALLDTDLHRLRFGYNKAVGAGKDEAYIAAVKQFAEANTEHELSAMARFQWAGVLQNQQEFVRAREVALAGQNAFPDSPGGKLCFNVVQTIEAKSSSASTERVWADPMPEISVKYKNLTKAWFRVVKGDYLQRMKQARWRPEQLDQNEQKALLNQDPVMSFTRDLPPTNDYKERTESFSAPKGLAPGWYHLLTSHDEKFSAQDNMVTYTDFWVSDLAIVNRIDQGKLRVEGFVTNNNSGEPLADAKVQVWFRSNNGGGWFPGDTATTDKNGMYALTGRNQHAHMVIASTKDQMLSSMHDSYLYQNNYNPQAQEQTVFFTDRSLYRPGQTIQYKGVCIRYFQEKDTYESIANREVTVVFSDPNGKEVAKQQARTNDYGSFSGSFTAPRDRLAGRMNIHVVSGPHGAAQFNVEEYKRPKFTTKVESPVEPAKLNAEVKAPGKATAYTGVPVGGAKVKYRVVREVRYPAWFHDYYWWRPVPQKPAQEIAHGTMSTEPDGSFVIPFTAKADPTVPEKDEPTFRFTVTAEVTDTTGETRVGTKTIEVGYAALKVSASAAEWQTNDQDVKFTVNTTTVDGLGQEAKGTLKVYALKQPEKVARPATDGQFHYRFQLVDVEPKPDPGKPQSWELGDVKFSTDFATDGKGVKEVAAKLPAGIYRVIVESQDTFGKKVTGKSQLQVLEPTAMHLNIRVPNIVSAPTWTVEPGNTFTMFWGSGYNEGRVFLEAEHRGKILQAFWTEPGRTQAQLKVPVTEEMRGGFTVRATFVHENRAYLTSKHVDVPWSNKDFTVKWETFRNKLEPGKKETFTAIVTGPDAKKAVAEMVAAVYDQSLDAYLPHDWMHKFGIFRHDYSNLHSQFENTTKGFNWIHGQWPQNHKSVDLAYRGFPGELTQNYYRYEYFGKGGGNGGFEFEYGYTRFNRGMAMDGMMSESKGMPMAGAAPPPMAPGAGFGGGGLREQAAKRDANGLGAELGDDKAATAGDPGNAGGPGPNLSGVAARKNLNETAFFFPHLVSDAEGVVRMEFTMPEALTKWKFLGFAHDKELKSGFLGDEIVTAKDLMAQPNPPRFLREGDVIEFPVKVSNQSPTRQVGKVALQFRDARTDAPVDLGSGAAEQAFDLPAGESKTFSWKITVPEGATPLAFKAVAASDRLSDGEAGVLPVLSKKVLVAESLPLPIRNAGTKEFDFAKLRDSAGSNSIRHQSFTVQMVSQPAWYAVMALPYLMESPHENTEATFNRLYANGLARHIGNSDPKIRKIFDLWKGTDALDSPLEKNQDLKSVILEETPWVRQAVKEGQSRKNVGILFDENRLNDETARLSAKLAQMQNNDGMWPWYPGGRSNEYMTLYITTGYGRLRHLGVKIDTAPAVRATQALDAWMDQIYREILRHSDPEKNHLSSTIALYLYGRSFFLQDRPVANEHKQAVDYWLGQAKKYWLQLANRQSQAHLAIGLKRFGDKETPAGIMASIKERSVSNEEMGMFWRDLELQQFWFRAPIETQAMMIEAFDEVSNDQKSVEECKVWLLKQKQTQDWKTTKATADAIYGLLLRGEKLLASDALVEVTVGNNTIVPEKVEAGTGFYEHKFLRTEVQPSMSAITLKKTDPGVSWGSVHWQYLEDLDKVTGHTAGPLKVEKRLFKKTYAKSGPKIDPFQGEALAVGDEVVVRVVLRTDRDMEYVHLKDHRGSGTEPVNVLSKYKYQDGLAYYESTKDTASHFYIDYLPKGNYVFEYSVRVQHRGKYPTGYANVQCLYAPEFNSHSENINLEVK
ncbi:MAG: alpha-2-macroglobulin family protein [Gemmataceae bacterium]